MGSSPGEAVLELAPFRGLRYGHPDPRALIDSPALDLALALAPPYDVVDARSVTDLVRAEPRNALRLTVPPAAGDAEDPFSTELAGPDRYQHAALTLRRWIDEGTLVRDPLPTLYVYEQTSPTGTVQRGLIGALRLPAPGSPVVRPHEEVSQTPVTDRARLMATTRANLEPIFLVYRGQATQQGRGAATIAVDRAAAEPAMALAHTVTADGTRHRLYGIVDPSIQEAVATDLAGHTALIADGHHRYAAYQRLRASAGPSPGPWNYGLAFLVDADAYPPHLSAIHRVLPGMDALRAAESAREVATVHAITPPGPPRGGGARHALRILSEAAARGPALLLAYDRMWYLIHRFSPAALATAMPSRSPRWRTLAPAVLHHLLLPRWRTNEDTLRFVHDDAAAALHAARPGSETATVLLPPLSMDDVEAVTAGGELVPRKSTSFGPKPRTGLVLRVVD